MSDRGWKKFERRVAKDLGGRRVPLSGGLSPESGLEKTDVMGTIFRLVECKVRARWSIPEWIKKLEAQTYRDFSSFKWLLVVKKPRTKRTYAILPLEELQALVQEAGMGDTDRAFVYRVLYASSTWHVEEWIEKAEEAAARQPWMVVLRRGTQVAARGIAPVAYAVVPFASVKVFVQEIGSRPAH